MAVNYVTIKGYVKEGKLEVDLPENVIDGEAKVTVVVLSAGSEANDNLENLPDIERSELLTGAEMVARGLTGGWKNMGIEDSVAWVEEQKRKRRERHQWQQD